MTSVRQEIALPGMPAPLSHYTDAVRWGDTLYVSGCAAIGIDGNVVGPGDIAVQARLVHEYLGAALTAGGSDFAHVLKVTVFLTDVNDRHVVNTLRQEFFGSARPASTLLVVKGLVLEGLLVEIEAVAGIISSRTGISS